MDSSELKKCAVGGICAILLGGAVINSASDNNTEMNITYSYSSEATDISHKTDYIFDDKQELTNNNASLSISTETTSISSAAQTPVEATSVSSAAQTPAETTSVSSTAQTPAEATSVSSTAQTPAEATSVSSTAQTSAATTTTKIITPSNSTILQAAAEPIISSDEHTTSVGNTVYVSNSGKYHSRPNCSGMKNYTEMSIDEAKAANYSACKKCYK